MITTHDFFENTGSLLRIPLKDPVLQEAFLKAPEAVKQVMANIQTANAAHVLRMSASADFGNAHLMVGNPKKDCYTAIDDMAVALTSVESVTLDSMEDGVAFVDGTTGSKVKVPFQRKAVELVCASGAAYRVVFYKNELLEQDKESFHRLLMQASTLTHYLYSLWVLRIGNTYPLLPKGSVYGN